MFGIDGTELLVVGLVALIVIGPKELPGLLRTIGAFTSRVRRMAWDFRQQFDEAMRDAELDQAKKTVSDLNQAARSATSFDPLERIRTELQAVRNEVSSGTAPASPLSPTESSPAVLPPASAQAAPTLPQPVLSATEGVSSLARPANGSAGASA